MPREIEGRRPDQHFPLGIEVDNDKTSVEYPGGEFDMGGLCL